ncbi:MAG: UTRA domain-containing protein [Rhodanobacter sp.]
MLQGTPVFHTVMVHLENYLAIQLEDRFVNPRGVPHYLQADFPRQTPNEVLVAACAISCVEHVIEAVAVDAHTARLLHMQVGQPCLSVVRRTWSDDRLASYARLIYPGDRYKLRSRYKR